MKVFIMSGSPAYSRLFTERGHSIVHLPEEADLVQFTGGADVSPILYSEHTHGRTNMDPSRDRVEKELFDFCLAAGIPMAGICRGSQFLHVMSGGKLWQHVEGHGVYGTHKAFDVDGGYATDVTSTHHQAMREGAGLGLLFGDCHERVESIDSDGNVEEWVLGRTLEAAFHKDSKCFCFQPHPEMADGESCRDYYFGALETFLGVW